MPNTRIKSHNIQPGTIQTADLAAEVTANINYAMATANTATQFHPFVLSGM
jgi:hypothetical protein